MKSYKELTVWKKAIELSTLTYKVTNKFPKTETYGLVSQIRRSAVAIPSNIAEGYLRGYTKEYIQFLRIAYSSGAELETQLVISLNIQYLEVSDYDNLNLLLEEVMKMLNKLINVLLISKTNH